MMVLAEEVQRENDATTLGKTFGVVAFQCSVPVKLQVAGRNWPQVR